MPENQELQMEVIPDDEWEWTIDSKEPRSRDVVWLDSREGIEWCLNKMPKDRPFPKDEEGKVVLKHLNMVYPGEALLEAMEGLTIHGRMIWSMPFYHSKYVSDVNAYYDWLCNGRPWFHTERLTEALLQRDMYPISLAIAKERQIVRRRAMRKGI